MLRKLELGVIAIAVLIFILHYLYDGFYLNTTYLFLLVAVVTGVSGVSAYNEGKRNFGYIYFLLSGFFLVSFIVQVLN
ncbi:hypothetical protein [Aquisalibacillus elongatus]|uniref:DUF3953 domain-containing protein n=1 Tax=Aquisalibacillus elongatus TaxID=485577 RepID=A0A3N5B8Y9_9BACI|nr:hypothetical protein [Aquisalibacillus elongatus]RPF53934.1 hypothetical protein EDC24_1119 [Aquisalibacillus elongatus]